MSVGFLGKKYVSVIFYPERKYMNKIYGLFICLDHLTVPEALQSLPDVEGIGRLRNLREAASLLPALARFSAADRAGF